MADLVDEHGFRIIDFPGASQNPVRTSTEFTPRRARVWLATSDVTTPEPTDHPVVSDGQLRVWCPTEQGFYATGGGRHRVTWTELRARHDLVEVTPSRMARASEWGWGAPPELGTPGPPEAGTP